jgi:hypothetical protein
MSGIGNPLSLAVLSRAEMEDELGRRGIAVYRVTSEYLVQELEALERVTP